MSNPGTFRRPLVEELVARLREPRRFLQVVSGPRQVGKTTAARQAAERARLPTRYASADEPTLRGASWIEQQWEAARVLAARPATGEDAGAVLILDETQKFEGWSETVKRLWDEDTHAGLPLRVLILGSASLLVGRGLTASLAGRFRIVRFPHWSYPEMREAFGFSLDEYLTFGGYPGAASLRRQPARWAQYLRDAILEPVLSRDVLLLTRVDKPALLRRLLHLGCEFSGQIVSYTKMLGQLQDAGNTTTLAHYLDLLSGAGLLTGLQKYSGTALRQRGSIPKLQVRTTALMTAQAPTTPRRAATDPSFRGRLVESAVGAHLVAAAASGDLEVFYWRERDREVDFVVRGGDSLVAIEVKSGRSPRTLPGMDAFRRAFASTGLRLRPLLVGGDGIPLESFLETPVERWLAGPV